MMTNPLDSVFDRVLTLSRAMDAAYAEPQLRKIAINAGSEARQIKA